MEEQCLYEVLGVDRSASIDEVRSAYRKQALRWHPDKIQQTGASEELRKEATERFQAISRAYEVLSDPSERAWYDSHRSAILSGGNAASEFEFNLWPYFSPSAFSGYGDTGKGFYAVYGTVFSSIFEREQVFARAYLSERLEVPPHFGGASSSHEEVSAFYNFWMSFKTVKDYSWCDEYRIVDAPNRKVRRLMMEENNKIRKKEQREFNEAVRQLVTFVKKRDKRVMERQMELQRIEKEKSFAQKARKQQLQQEKLAKLNEYKEEEWSKIDDDEDFYNWDSSLKEKADGERQEFYCVVCEKRFRSQKQWENHEKSKKHMERAANLKVSFMEEDEQFQSQEPAPEDEVESVPSNANISEEDQQEALASTDEEDQAPYEHVQEMASGSDDNDDEGSMLEAMLNSHQSRSAAAKDDESTADEFSATDKLNSRSRRKSRQAKERTAVAERHASLEAELREDIANVRLDSEGEEQQSAGDIKQQKKGKGSCQLNQSGKSADSDGDEEELVHAGAVKKNRKKGKMKAANKQGEAKLQQATKPSKGKKTAKLPSTQCEVCGQEFESRNLLFKHMDASKHFVLKGK